MIIVEIIRFMAISITSALTLISELPLKILCGILSIILLFIGAIVAPIIKNLNIPDKLDKFLENFCEYGLSFKNWFFIKVFNIYNETLQL